MKRVSATIMTVLLIAGGTACSSGPSEHERAEFQKLVLERQGGYPTVVVLSVPTSVKEYVLGGGGMATADYIVAGSFTGGRLVPASEGSADSTLSTLIGEFRLHQSLRGSVPSEFDVDLGTTKGGFVASTAMKGAGDVVLFLRFDASEDAWALIDDQYALAQSDGGTLSMPLVPASMESQYLSGVIDVADIEAMIIAGNYDPNGSLTGELDDLGNEGTGQYQDLIDQANDLTD